MSTDWKNKMRESLEDWQAAEPDGLWEGIESGLAERSARRKILPFWIGSAAAAAAIVLAVLLPGLLPEETVGHSEEVFAKVDRTMETSSEDDSGPAIKEMKEVKEIKRIPSFQAVAPAAAQTAEVYAGETLLQQDYDLPEERRDSVLLDREASEAQQVRDYWKAVEQGAMDIKGYVRSRRKFALAASVGGTQGSRNVYGNYGGFAYSDVARQFSSASSPGDLSGSEGNMGFTELSTVLLDNLDREITTTIHHHQPVRYSLELEYMLTDRLGLTGGISYSRHSSEITSGSEGSSYTTKQKIDYIGLPLSLDLYLLKNERAGLYGGFGGVVEKSVAGRSVTGYAYGSSTQTGEAFRFVEKQLQWSVNASLGADLRIVRGLKLFAEPGIAYYFDNGSDVDNIYKERPLMFNFQVGLRTDLR